MKKARSLREALTAAVPEIAGEPDRLLVWVEEGSGKSTQSATLGFAFEYRLNLLLVETRADIALVALAVFQWLRVHQPERLSPGAEGFGFDADILDNETADILITLDLRENVSVAAAAGGGHVLTYLDEPDPLFDDGLGFGGAEPVPLLEAVDFSAVEVEPRS